MTDAALHPSAAAPAFRFSATETAKHVVLILGALIVLLPFYVMVSYSVKAPHEIMQQTGGFFGGQELFRDDFCIKLGNAAEDCMVRPLAYNYTTAFEKAPLLLYLWQTASDCDPLDLRHSGDRGTALRLCAGQAALLGP